MSSAAHAAEAPDSARRRSAKLTRGGATWLYVIALYAVATGAFLAFVHGTSALVEPHLPWWALVIGFLVAERCVVDLHFRRSAHSFSLADIPFVFGLLFATGDGLVVGALLGAGIVWAARRMPTVKLAFNVAQLALAASVASAILRAVAPNAASLGPKIWIGVYMASLASGALTILCIAGAISIAEGALKLATVRQMFVMDGLVTAANTSVGIAAALVLSADARALPVLLVPALIAFASYRAYLEGEAALRAQAEELRASRARVARAADAERGRIERDLHDGVQQHLVGLSVNLRLARELAASQPAESVAVLGELERASEEALRELRDLTHGIYPPLLAAHGLRRALVAAVSRLPVRAAVDADGLGRYAPDVEATVYFCCVEGLQNVAKHAGADAFATVRLREQHGALVLTVRDDGRGFDSAAGRGGIDGRTPERRAGGSGLVGIADRLAAIGGSLEVDSAPGAGTTLTAVVPAQRIRPARPDTAGPP